jgi:hypothetical protein
MMLLRILRPFGALLIAVAGIVAIFEPKARPNVSTLILPLAVAAAAGLVIGLGVRFGLTSQERIRLLHALSPRIARRFLPLRPRRPDDDDDH